MEIFTGKQNKKHKIRSCRENHVILKRQLLAVGFSPEGVPQGDLRENKGFLLTLKTIMAERKKKT